MEDSDFDDLRRQVVALSESLKKAHARLENIDAEILRVVRSGQFDDALGAMFQRARANNMLL